MQNVNSELYRDFYKILLIYHKINVKFSMIYKKVSQLLKNKLFCSIIIIVNTPDTGMKITFMGLEKNDDRKTGYEKNKRKLSQQA